MPKKTSTATTSKKTAPRLVANKTATITAASELAATAEIVTEAQIAERAFYIYLNEGCPEGRHLDHWFKAVSEFRV